MVLASCNTFRNSRSGGDFGSETGKTKKNKCIGYDSISHKTIAKIYNIFTVDRTGRVVKIVEINRVFIICCNV